MSGMGCTGFQGLRKMDKSKILTSLEKFNEWQPRYNTHSDRYMGLIRRHTANAKEWADAMQNHPVNSPEFAAEVNRLSGQLESILAECGEVMDDLGRDNALLAEVFFSFYKELKDVVR